MIDDPGEALGSAAWTEGAVPSSRWGRAGGSKREAGRERTAICARPAVTPTRAQRSRRRARGIICCGRMLAAGARAGEGLTVFAGDPRMNAGAVFDKFKKLLGAGESPDASAERP